MTLGVRSQLSYFTVTTTLPCRSVPASDTPSPQALHLTPTKCSQKTHQTHRLPRQRQVPKHPDVQPCGLLGTKRRLAGWVLQTAVSTAPGLPTLQSGQNPHTWGPQMLDFKPNAVLGFLKAPQAQVMGRGSREGKFIWLLKIGSAKPHPQSEQHSTVHVIKGVGPPPMVGGTPEVLPVVQEVSNV